MLNYFKADCCRLFSGFKARLWVLALIVLPPVTIVAAKSQYELEQIRAAVPAAIYLAFILLALSLNEFVFWEEKRHGVFKNDTTNGISRNALFLSKFFTSVFLETALWVLTSAACALALTYLSGTVSMGRCFAQMFSHQALLWLVQTIFYIALFQTIRTFADKISVLILVCAVLSTLYAQLRDLISQASPTLAAVMSGENIAAELAMLIIGILVVLYIGCRLFRRSEF